MGFLKHIKQYWEDFTLWVELNKLKFLFTTLFALVALVAGCVIFANCKQGWWYANRCNHVQLLLCGNFFSTFLSLLFEAMLVLLLMYVSQIHKHLTVVSFLVVFIGGIYCGAHLACLFSCVGALALLFFVFYTALSLAILLIPCFVRCDPTEYCKTPCEILHDSKDGFFVVICLSILRILLLFLLLRPICGSI